MYCDQTYGNHILWIACALMCTWASAIVCKHKGLNMERHVWWLETYPTIWLLCVYIFPRQLKSWRRLRELAVQRPFSKILLAGPPTKVEIDEHHSIPFTRMSLKFFLTWEFKINPLIKLNGWVLSFANGGVGAYYSLESLLEGTKVMGVLYEWIVSPLFTFLTLRRT